ncbi:flagellar M-ring protein FliF [Clostridium acidisoli DSM 12555]|jgi:flagellar M-ring protein FliF|uniref:Flagellar M-ring protein n=1 Tax=Clostridium acidisoli DSM 12555 TaxID=1121291 RepID=A0A1W1X1N3_9CLOT|nr:flagellar basal-body MS-ring/collar protein FliF [Clostridium acidisoli]SMC17876.1 flagellar M-ring protein FliF [Clostridium acidisoli DSM 12555]
MNKLLDGFRKLKDKWLGISKIKKIAIGVLFVGIIVAAVLGTMNATSTKYGVLFSKMDSTDANAVITKLKSDKVTYKVDSSTNTIYVPTDKVDDLRLQYATTIKNGSTGFELFDSSSSQYGMTDQQFNVQYQRALQGEIERTIKSFPQVSDARVELVMPEDSVFVKDSSAAKASVFLKLNDGQTLSKSQVKAIVSLISGAVKNLPTENIQVVDQNMTLLSANLNNGTNNDGTDVSETTAARSEAEEKEENELQEKVLSQLEPVYGKGNVKVQVHADMNFDATQQDATTETNPVIVSEHDINEVNSNGSNAASGSPNDNNNSSNQIVNSNSTGGTSTHTETTKNYDTSKTETKTTTAPGNINRLTVSVVVDGTVSNATQTSINNIVSQAVGINPQRGDTVSIEGLRFDTTLQDAAKKAQADMNATQQQAQKNAFIRNIIIAGVVGVIAIAGLIIFLIKRRKKNREDDESEFDELIGDDMDETSQVKFAPIQFEEANEKSHMEQEIRNYASNKPDQVADVVKAWLSEEER